jgi:hypothetical protein
MFAGFFVRLCPAAIPKAQKKGAMAECSIPPIALRLAVEILSCMVSYEIPKEEYRISTCGRSSPQVIATLPYESLPQ